MSLIRLHRTREEAGQSTVEFALMIPVIMTFFFWVFQVNIFILGYHQMAYASFAAARSHVVERSQGPQEQQVMDAILTGKIFKENTAGRPTITHDSRMDDNWGVSDGVTLKHPGFESLPYVRGLFSIKAEVPTHLGPSEYDMGIRSYNGNDRAKATTRKKLTDNNVEDFP